MQFFRILAKRSLRISLIVLVVGAVLGFGHFMTPRGSEAYAKVFYDLGETLSSPGMPEFMKMQVDEGAVQEVTLNGNKLFYTLYRTDKSIDTLLDYYENLYQSKQRVIAPPEARQALLKYVKNSKDRAEHERRINETEKILNDRFIRFEGKAWGGFATIVTGKEGDADYSNDMIARFRKFKKSGMATDLGDPKILVAFKDPSRGDTQYFNVWPADDFDFRNIRPRGEDDAPGGDVLDVPRPFGSRRMVSFAQEHGGTTYEILSYRGRGTAEEVLENMVGTMLDNEWAISAHVEESRQQLEDPEHVGLFSKDDGREAWISVKDEPETDEATTTVVIYDRG
jgi:hypothetical protein